MIIKQQVDYAKALTSSSSELYEWANVGNESIRGDFGYTLGLSKERVDSESLNPVVFKPIPV